MDASGEFWGHLLSTGRFELFSEMAPLANRYLIGLADWHLLSRPLTDLIRGLPSIPTTSTRLLVFDVDGRESDFFQRWGFHVPRGQIPIIARFGTGGVAWSDEGFAAAARLLVELGGSEDDLRERVAERKFVL